MKGNTFQHGLHEEKLFSPFKRLCTHKTNCLSALRKFVSFRIDFLWFVSYIPWIIRKFYFFFHLRRKQLFIGSKQFTNLASHIKRKKFQQGILRLTFCCTFTCRKDEKLKKIILWILKQNPGPIVFITVHTRILPIIRHAPTASRMVKISEGKPECACVNIRFPAIPPT